MNTQTVSEKVGLIQQEFNFISCFLDERRVRLWCAARAKAYDLAHGRGGISAVRKATGVSRPMIYKGLKEIGSEDRPDKARVRQSGGGRRKITEKQPGILGALENLVEPLTRGDPESHPGWTCKSTYRSEDELISQGYEISQPQVGKLLGKLGCSLRSDRKTEEGGEHCDRDDQSGHINEKIIFFQKLGLPAVSVGTKKKENIGNYENKGKEYHGKWQPGRVKIYDFIDKKLGKVAPYGIYDIDKNKGFANVGISSDTAEFAANPIRNWWYGMGRAEYRNATELLITADCGGSNSNRARLWKTELRKLADELGMIINVCHFPPGTSKWNKIGHRMFCHITKSWRGRPLVSRETVVNPIGNTKTKKGLKIKAKPDENIYGKGRKITDSESESVNIERSDFHGEWNYRIKMSDIQ